MPHKGHAHSIGSIVPSARSRYAGQRSEAQEKLRPSAPSIRITTGSPTRSCKGLRGEVLKRDFPIAAEELMRRLGMRPGADVRLAFTKIGNDFWAIRLK